MPRSQRQLMYLAARIVRMIPLRIGPHLQRTSNLLQEAIGNTAKQQHINIPRTHILEHTSPTIHPSVAGTLLEYTAVHLVQS